MIKKLYRKLIYLYTFITGFILTLVVISIAVISQMAYKNQHEETFQNQMLNLSSQFQTDYPFHVTALSTLEADNNLLIHIEENGTPLLFKGAWSPKTARAALIEAAKNKAMDLGVNLSVRPISAPSITPIFHLKGEKNDQYDCIAFVYPQGKNYKSILLLSYTTPLRHKLRFQQFLFILFDLFGILALYFVNRKFVKDSVKPLEISTKKQKEFIAAASHELRSPLMVIQASAQAMEMSPKDAPEFISAILENSKRMSRLISDMLSLASSDAGTWSMHFECLDSNTLLLDFYELNELLFMEQKTPFLLELPEESLPPISADRERIIQLLSVLIHNALSYNKDCSPVILKAFIDKRFLHIQVIDHGIGIPDESKEQVFERFLRLDSSRKKKEHFGLGLSIAKELTELHHGKICVLNTPGGGSTFDVMFPIIS